MLDYKGAERLRVRPQQEEMMFSYEATPFKYLTFKSYNLSKESD